MLNVVNPGEGVEKTSLEILGEFQFEPLFSGRK